MEPAISAASTTAISTAAVPIRTTILERRAALSAAGFAGASATSIGDLLGTRAEATLPPLIGGDSLVEVGLSEIGPERLGAVKLGIGGLPEQEVTEPHFARRADDEVRIRQASGVQTVRQAGLLELREICAGPRQLSNRVDDLAAAAVIDGNVEHDSSADAGMFAGLAHLFLQSRRQLVNAAGESQLDSTPRQLFHLSANGLGEEAHQGVYLVARA